jgi:hypothetical protein
VHLMCRVQCMARHRGVLYPLESTGRAYSHNAYTIPSKYDISAPWLDSPFSIVLLPAHDLVLLTTSYQPVALVTKQNGFITRIGQLLLVFRSCRCPSDHWMGSSNSARVLSHR